MRLPFALALPLVTVLASACSRPSPRPSPSPAPSAPSRQQPADSAVAPTSTTHARAESQRASPAALTDVEVPPAASGGYEATAHADGQRVRLHFTDPKSGWMFGKGAAPGELVAASGPPGGPAGFRVTVLRRGHEVVDDVLERFATQRGATPGAEPFELGARERVAVDANAAPALAFSTGQSMATSRTCLVAIERSDLLFVLEGVTGGAEPRTCASVLQDHALAAIWSALVIEEPR